MFLKKIFVLLIFLFFSLLSHRSFSEAMGDFAPELEKTLEPSYSIKDFLFTSLYGTLLGSIIGTVSMGLDVNQNQNPRRIAIGASLGFYGGLLVGLYSFYTNKRNSRLQSIRENLYPSLPFVFVHTKESRFFKIFIDPILSSRP